MTWSKSKDNGASFGFLVTSHEGHATKTANSVGMSCQFFIKKPNFMLDRRILRWLDPTSEQYEQLGLCPIRRELWHFRRSRVESAFVWLNSKIALKQVGYCQSLLEVYRQKVRPCRTGYGETECYNEGDYCAEEDSERVWEWGTSL